MSNAFKIHWPLINEDLLCLAGGTTYQRNKSERNIQNFIVTGHKSILVEGGFGRTVPLVGR
jgi:hypothetical protein